MWWVKYLWNLSKIPRFYWSGKNKYINNEIIRVNVGVVENSTFILRITVVHVDNLTIRVFVGTTLGTSRTRHFDTFVVVVFFFFQISTENIKSPECVSGRCPKTSAHRVVETGDFRPRVVRNKKTKNKKQ